MATTPVVVGFGVDIVLVALDDEVGVLETEEGVVGDELEAVGCGASCATFPQPLKTAMSKRTNSITR